MTIGFRGLSYLFKRRWYSLYRWRNPRNGVRIIDVGAFFFIFGEVRASSIPLYTYDLVLCRNDKCPYNLHNSTLSLMFNVCNLQEHGRRLLVDKEGRCEAFLLAGAQREVKE